MAGASFDVAVFGATPFALLVAGLLRATHGKRVCVVGDPWSPYRLPRGFDVSVMPVTRPETWALLKRGTAETTKLLASLGKGLGERVDPLFVAETAVGTDYLGHMRWVAFGLGYAAEPAVDPGVTASGTICRMRDAVMLVGGRIEPALEAWLDRLEVPRFPARDAILAFPRNAHATIAVGDATHEAETVILADDEAILAHLTPAERHRLLTVAPSTSLVTEPARPLGAALIHYLDRAVTLHQRQMRGAIEAIAAGEGDVALPRIASTLAAQGRLRRSGQTVIRCVATADGAPLIGRMGKGKATVIAGLGAAAAFLAPIVARVLAGVAPDDEAQYFAQRETARAANRQSVAEAAAAEPAS